MDHQREIESMIKGRQEANLLLAEPKSRRFSLRWHLGQIFVRFGTKLMGLPKCCLLQKIKTPQ